MGKANYAYLDKYGILHVVSDQQSARNYCSGSIIATEVPCKGGYPLVEVMKNGKSVMTEITVYSLKESVIFNSIPVDVREFPEIESLYKAL